jgi:hypothetical protein
MRPRNIDEIAKAKKKFTFDRFMEDMKTFSHDTTK